MKPTKSLMFARKYSVIGLALLLLTSIAIQIPAADAGYGPDQEKEAKLIAILKSDSPPQDKAIPCKQLAIHGTKDAVPALAALLSNADLASWARIALEAIPDSAADDALRAAMGNLQGKLLVGVINSIAVRHDAKAVNGLVRKLNDENAEVASAAAVALGHIGGPAATRALSKALQHSPEGVRSAVAEGSILCAEKFFATGKNSDAIKIYDHIRKSAVPKQRVLEATRGAILARGSAGVPLLLEQLRAEDKGLLAIGLRTARELPGREVTEALTTELKRTSPDRQANLLLAVGDRTDAAVLPAVLEAARAGTTKLRLVAIGILDRMGNPSSISVLLEAAASEDAEVELAGLTALARMPGNKVDADLLGRISQASGKMRCALIELAGQRRIEAALPAIVQSAEDSNAVTRNAAFKALGVLGTEKEVGELVRMLAKIQEAKERDEIETALIGISGRTGSACVKSLEPLSQSSDSGLRVIALHVFATAGGAEALAAVKSALEDKDESVQDEAVRTLSTWPNNWPDDAAVAEPLLMLAKSGKKMSQQVLGMRGYLLYVRGDRGLKDDQKVSKVSELMPLLTRPEEKRLAIAAIDGVTTPAGLELLLTFAAEPAIADDACSAIIVITGKKVEGVSKEQRQKALDLVLEKTSNDDTKKRAQELRNKLQGS
jgi:HEAT repeat protein